MKKLTLLCCMLLSFAASAQKAVLPIDSKASILHWTGHAEIGNYAPMGTLAIKDGQIVTQNDVFSTATLTIDMTSLQQDNAELAHHLKSSDFFDVDKYPTAVLAIDKVAAGKVYGTLTIKGKSAPFASSVKVTQNNDRFLISGKVDLDRTQYGIVYNSTSFFSGLGNKAIRNTFEVEFTIAGIGKLPNQYRF